MMTPSQRRALRQAYLWGHCDLAYVRRRCTLTGTPLRDVLPEAGTDPDPGGINRGARCSICVRRGIEPPGPAHVWHPVIPNTLVCERHAGCTCNGTPDATCPVHTGGSA